MNIKRLLGATALVGVLAGFPTIAAAQTAAAPAAASEPAADDKDAPEVIVTGSRIKRDVFNSPSPITIVTRNDATAAGFNSTSELLQSTAITAGARQIDNTFAGFITDGGPGANTLSLRGLGAARTLILLNGRRLAPSGTSGSVVSADLNVLPSAIVDRIEILKDGASSIYGSDAIAGVVNIITDKRTKGLTLDGGVSVPQVGEGVTKRIAAIFGYNGDRFRISGSAEYYKRDMLSFGAHDYLRCQTDYIRSAPGQPLDSGSVIDPRTGKAKCYPTGPTGDSGVTVNTIGTSTRAGAAGGPGNAAIGSFNRFRVNPSAGGSVPGFEGVNGGGSSGLGNRDTVNDNFFKRSLVSPTENFSGYLQSEFALHALGDATLYFDGLFTRRSSNQPAFFQAILDYRYGSPLIPSVLAFSNIGATDQSGGFPVGVRVFTSRNYQSRQSVDYMRIGGGIRGNLPLNDWTYDFYAGRSYTSGKYYLQQLVTSRLIQSQSVVANGSGGYNCTDASNGCVAAPVLTADVINGNIPQAYLNFVAPEVKGTTKFGETTFSAQFAGNLFALPGGNVGVAIGAEYRKQKIDDQPPIEQQTGQLYSYSTAGITQGRDAVKEVFGEIELPFLRNRPFFETLTLNASGRYTNYDSYGTGWTYKFGGVWSPVKGIQFRGTYGTSFRAPALSEQFEAATAGFLSTNTDPCYQYYNSAPTTTIYKNCQAAGVPLNYGRGNAGDPLAQSVRVLTTGGAGSGLSAEKSKNWTVGAVLQPSLPSAFGKFEFAVDYFNITVNNGVAQYGGSAIISACYNDPQFTSGTNGGQLCQFVTRDPSTGTLPYRATVTNAFINISTNKVRGLDFNMRYVVPIATGSLRLNIGATKYLEQASKIRPTDPLNDANGQIYFPKWTGTLDATYSISKVSFYYGLNWVGKMDSFASVGEDPNNSIYQFATPNYFTHSASVRLTNDKFSFTVGVKNFTDKEPPQISAYVFNRLGNSPLYSGFDFVGRTVFSNVTAKF